MNKNRKTIKMPVRYLMNAVLVALLFVALSYLTRNILSTYQNKVLMTVGINIILAVSLNVATGYLGQLPLGHAGFMAVGAYTCALFTKFCPLRTVSPLSSVWCWPASWLVCSVCSSASRPCA